MKKFITLICLMVLFSGCSQYTVKEDINISPYKDKAAENDNLLIIHQSRLAIPDGWKFVAPDTKPVKTANFDSAVFFQFNDRVNNCFGKFEYTTFKNFSGNLSGMELAKLYAEKILTDITDKVIHKTFINGKEAYIIVGKHAKKNWDFMTALIPEGHSFNEIRILSDPGYLTMRPEIAYRIFASYEYASAGVNERTVKDVIKFRCSDDKWFWTSDWHAQGLNGFMITDSSKYETPVEYVGVSRSESINISNIKTLLDSFNEEIIVPEFSTTLTIGDGTNLPVKAVVSKNRKDLISVYYLYKKGRTTHIIMVCYKVGATSCKPEKIHEEWQDAKDALSYFFL